MNQGHVPSSPAARRRAALTLGGVAVALVTVTAVAVGWAGSWLTTGDDTAGAQAPPVATPAPPADAEDGGWDVAAQTELASRPMLELPDDAARPHQLVSEQAGPALRLPEPDSGTDELVPGGFPRTEEGAVAQVIALTEAGLAGGDPQTYVRAYDSIALPGAPAASSTRLYRNLTDMRSAAGLPSTGPVPEFSLTWTPTSGLVKGTTDDGAYAVVCVLGEVVVQLRGRSVAAAGGDCQALRWDGGQWRISPGAAAAPGPLAWPGTAEAVRAGYREVR